MGIFSRLADIVNANITSLLDKAEDPEKMIRLIIQEMEDTLVEVRSTSARVLAEKKDLARKVKRIEAKQEDWQNKAVLAISKDREDLAKAALMEKQKLAELHTSLMREADVIEQSLNKLSEEVSQLEQKLQDTRARQKSIQLRQRAASGRLDVKKHLDSQKMTKTMERFDQFERRIDELEGEADAFDMGKSKSLDDEFASLEVDDAISKELADLKKKINKD